MIEWFLSNMNWLLSGILVSVPIAIFGFSRKRRQRESALSQKSGDNSKSYQAGKNINITINKND